MNTLFGKEAMITTFGGLSETVLFDQMFEVEGFQLRAYHEFESFFEDPKPYLKLELTSAGVIPFIQDSNSILLVETNDGTGTRRVELPSGKVEDRDNSILDTATREFFEETGLEITKENLQPFMVRYQQDGRGGLQFVTEIAMQSLEVLETDRFGRVYFAPIDGTDNGRTVRLISEPLDVFIDQHSTLLQDSRHPWAIDMGVRETLRLIGKKRLEKLTSKKRKGFISRIFNKGK